MSEVEKTRSAEKEADLDRKIQEIRRRNEELEERHKIVTEEAKQNGVPKSFQKATVNGGHKSGSNHANLKTSETIPTPKKGNGIAEPKGNNNQWSREWDRGKTSAEDWKMNVPEFGDHGNSYFKTESANGNNSSSRGRGGARGGGAHHQQQQRSGGARRPGGAQGKQPPHNPGFFHDDRCDKNKTDENSADSGTPTTPGSNDGKQSDGNKKLPARNNPRKPATTHRSSENDKNQNDSSKPNMNVSNNGFGPRQDHRRGGGASTQSSRNFNQPPRRGAAAGNSGAGFRQQPPHNTTGVNGGDQSTRKPMQKVESGVRTQNIKDSNNGAAADKQQRSGPANRGRNFKPFNKPAQYSNPRQNKAPTTKSNNGTAKPQNPKLDKDGQAVKRLIDNIIDQVVRQERKEQKKSEEEGEGDERVDGKQNESTEVAMNTIVNEEKKSEEKTKEDNEGAKSENAGVEEEKKDGMHEFSSDEKTLNENKSNDGKQPTPESNSNEAATPSLVPESKPAESENAQDQKPQV